MSMTTIEYDESERERIEALLRDLGADEITIGTARRNIRNVDIRSLVNRFTVYVQDNPGVVLGALSALVAGGAVAAGAAAKKRSSSRKSAARSTKSAKSSKKSSAKKRASSSKRTLIEPHPGDKRYIRRDAKGRIKESDDVGRSLAADRRRKSKTSSKRGQGDRGDR